MAIPLRDLCVSAVNNYWEASSLILPGNSGGPVYDAKTHEVIKIAVWIKVYNGHLVTTMAGIVSIQTVEEIGGVKAKRFKDAVADSQGRVTDALRKKTLRITGDKIHGIGAAAIACFWMTGEPTVAGKLRPGDQVTAGAPYRICWEEFVQSLRATLMSRLIQGGMLISNSEYQPGSISAQNTITNNLVQGFVDPALGLMAFTPGGGSCVDFLLEDGIFKLQIRATQA